MRQSLFGPSRAKNGKKLGDSWEEVRRFKETLLDVSKIATGPLFITTNKASSQLSSRKTGVCTSHSLKGTTEA